MRALHKYTDEAVGEIEVGESKYYMATDLWPRSKASCFGRRLTFDLLRLCVACRRVGVARVEVHRLQWRRLDIASRVYDESG